MLVERLDQLARLSEIGRRQHLARLAPGHDLAREQQRHGEMRAHLLDIVQRGEHGAALRRASAGSAR